MSKVALILAGCGFQDGAENHEAVLCLLALAQAGHSYHCFAPDVEQTRVVNHLTGEEVQEKRNTLVESARIARGEISPLSELKIDEFDSILLPGGFGAALNLSSYALDGAACTVDEDLKRVLLGMHSRGKPIGATCITPAPLAKVFQGVAPVTLTLGSQKGTAEQLEAMGATAVKAGVAEMVADEENKIFTTPCYMEPADLVGMFEGIKKVVERL